MTFASFTKYMMLEIKKHLKISRKKRHRIRTTYLNLRKLNKYEGWSDIILLNSIVEGLIELEEPYSKDEVYSAFREISNNDYSTKERRRILTNLLRAGKDKSVF